MLRRDKLLSPHLATSGPGIKQGGIRGAGLTHRPAMMAAGASEPAGGKATTIPPCGSPAPGLGSLALQPLPNWPWAGSARHPLELRREARAASGRSFGPWWVLPSSGLATAGFRTAKCLVDEWFQNCWLPHPTLPAQGRPKGTELCSSPCVLEVPRGLPGERVCVKSRF